LYELLVVHNSVQPSEFWEMSPKEVLFYIKAKVGEDNKTLNDNTVNRLDERRAELEAKGVVVI